MNTKSIEKIVKEAIAGNELPFNRFLEDLYKYLSPKLYSLTNSKAEADDIFITSMQKFWERFVMNQEKLPHNSEGYVYMMCKNAWLMSKRHPWSSVVLHNTLYEYHNTTDDTIKEKNHFNQETEQEWLKMKALSEGLESLSPKCKTLIETEIDQNTKLKDLQDTLGYKNYQALVQAKYNCKKRLIKKVYEIMNRMKTV